MHALATRLQRRELKSALRNSEPKLRVSGEMHAMAVGDGTSGGRTNHERRGVVTLHKL